MDKRRTVPTGQSVVVKNGWSVFPLGSLKSQTVLWTFYYDSLTTSQPTHASERPHGILGPRPWHHHLFHFNDAGYLENDDVILRRRERASVAINDPVPRPVVSWREFTCCLTVTQCCRVMYESGFRLLVTVDTMTWINACQFSSLWEK